MTYLVVDVYDGFDLYDLLRLEYVRGNFSEAACYNIMDFLARDKYNNVALADEIEFAFTEFDSKQELIDSGLKAIPTQAGGECFVGYDPSQFPLRSYGQ